MKQEDGVDGIDDGYLRACGTAIMFHTVRREISGQRGERGGISIQDGRESRFFKGLSERGVSFLLYFLFYPCHIARPFDGFTTTLAHMISVDDDVNKRNENVFHMKMLKTLWTEHFLIHENCK